MLRSLSHFQSQSESELNNSDSYLFFQVSEPISAFYRCEVSSFCFRPCAHMWKRWRGTIPNRVSGHGPLERRIGSRLTQHQSSGCKSSTTSTRRKNRPPAPAQTTGPAREHLQLDGILHRNGNDGSQDIMAGDYSSDGFYGLPESLLSPCLGPVSDLPQRREES